MMFLHNVQSVPSLQPKSTLRPQARTIITRIHSISLLPFRPSSTVQKSTFVHQDTRKTRTRSIRNKLIQSTREKEASPTKTDKIQWVKGELIGKGSYAKVYLGLNATTGEIMAVKQVELPQTPSDLLSSRHRDITEALRFEGKTLKGLDHPNIVQYLGYDESPQYLSIFLEYVPGGTISSCLQKHGRFSEEVTKSFAHQMLEGLEYLHCKGIIHRDLKSDNILVEPSGVCKISDFGISKQAEDIQGRAYTGMRGTIFWMAPEILDNDKERGYNYKVDIWSVGCIVLEMWTGERPWFPEEVFPVMIKLSQQKLAPPIPPDLNASQDALDFRRQCFQIDPRNRPSAAELQDHPYLELPAGWKFETSEIEEFPLRRKFSQLSRKSGKSHRTYRRLQTSLQGDPEATSRTIPLPPTEDNNPTYRLSKGLGILNPRVHSQPIPQPAKSGTDDGPPVVYIVPRSSQPTRRAPSPNNSSRTSLDTSGSLSTARKGFRIFNPDPEPEINAQPFVYQPPPLPAFNADSPYSARLVTPVIQTIDESYPPHLRNGQPSTSSRSSGNFLERAASRYPNQHPSGMSLTSSSAHSESSSEDDNDFWAKRPTDLGAKRAVPQHQERSFSRNHRISGKAPSHLSGHDEWTRPAAAEVYENLQEFFPEFDLDKSVSIADSSKAKQGNDKIKRKAKSIRMVAEERNSRTLQRRTKLWDSKVEELRM